MEVVGWLGAILFALCAVPQALISYKQGHSNGLSGWFLGMWLLGEILSLIYCIVVVKSIPILFNYSFSLLCLLIIGRYKIWPRH
jgi:uncharacterized protein with PQ loop repeat